MNLKICEAIKNKNLIKFRYEGSIKTVEPYCYGIHKSTGNEVLSGYQISGISKSGKMSGLKLFKVTEMAEIEITNEHFKYPRDGNKSTDSRLSTTFCNFQNTEASNKL